MPAQGLQHMRFVLLLFAACVHAVNTQGLLVVHAGAHKTGTTTTQDFMRRYGSWIENKFNVHVPVGKWPLDCLDEKCKLLQDVSRKLQKKGTVLISSEAFGYGRGRKIHNVLMHLKAFAKITAVMVHRRTFDWMRSMWSHVAETSNSVGHLTFSTFLTETHRSRQSLSRSSFVGYERLVASHISEQILVVSLDKLLEENSTTAAFLICNASCGYTGRQFAECDGLVSSKEQSIGHLHTTTPPLVMAVQRLARLIHLVDCGENALKQPLKRIPYDRIAEIARTFPTTCDSLPKLGETSILSFLSHEFDASFLKRVNASPPKHRASSLCLLDEDRLSVLHMNLIRSLTEPCAKPR